MQHVTCNARKCEKIKNANFKISKFNLRFMFKNFFLFLFFMAAGTLVAAVSASAQTCPQIYQGINCTPGYYCGGCKDACPTCPGGGDPVGATQLNYVSCACGCPSGQIACNLPPNTCVTPPACSTPTRENAATCNGCGACKAGYSSDPLLPDSPNPCLKTAYIDYANTGYFSVSGDIKSTGGDLYLASGKAIRIDGSGVTTLNIGNWGSGGGGADVSVWGNLNIGDVSFQRGLAVSGGVTVGAVSNMGAGKLNAVELCIAGVCRTSWPATITDHTLLSNLSVDSHSQYALLAGRAGGQNLRGGTAASENLRLESTSNSTKGYVLINPSGGNVGIGTTSPQGILDIKQEPIVVTDHGVKGLILRKSRANTLDDVSQITFTFRDSPEPSAQSVIRSITTNSGDGRGRLEFSTRRLAGAEYTGQQLDWTPDLVINSAGNVGIGTMSPSYTLDVSSSGARAINAATSNTGGYAVYGSATATGAVTNYGSYFKAAGDSGRGVYGEAAGTGGARGVFGFASGASGTNYGVYGQVTSSAGWAGYFTGGQGLFIDKDLFVGGTLETIANAGFAMTGTGAGYFADKLGVEGNIYTDNSFIAGTSTTYADGSITKTTGSALNVVLGGAAGDDFTIDTDVFVVESDNNRVGVGTASPAYTLDVSSSGARAINAATSNTGGYAVYGSATATGAVTNYGSYFKAAGDSGRGVYGEATSTTASATNYGGYFQASGTGYGAGGVYGSATATGAVTNYGGKFTAAGDQGQGVYGEATSATAGATNYGGLFIAKGTSGRGVAGSATAIGASTNYGGYFYAKGSGGRGVYGEADATGAAAGNYGGYFQAKGDLGYGVYGEATSTTAGATNYGGYFKAKGSGGRGVYGEADATGAYTNYGGYFEAAGTAGAIGVRGSATGTTGTNIGVYGVAESGYGVKGYSDSSSGVAIYGDATNGAYAGIFTGGYVGIGTTSPAYELVVSGTSPRVYIKSTSDNPELDLGDVTDENHWAIYHDTATEQLRFWRAAADRMIITSDGKVGIGRSPASNALEVEGDASKTTAGSWLANSDIRIKQEIQTLGGALGVIGRLRPVKFKYTEAYRQEHPSIKDQYYVNFIAQEYSEVFPEAVVAGDDANHLLALDTHDAFVYGIAAIKELNEKVESALSKTLVIDDSGNVVVKGDFSIGGDLKAENDKWGSGSGWISCPAEGECACPNGSYITAIEDRGARIMCNKL